MTSIVAAVLILLTGAFLAPLFEDLPQATLAAIVVVAIASFFRVDELRRYAGLYRLALVNALVALTVKDRIVSALGGLDGKPTGVVLDLSRNDEIDVGSLDMLKDLADALAREGVELRLANVHAPVLELLRRDGLADRVRIEPTLDAAGGVGP